MDKYNFKKDVKQIWCPGCGLYSVFNSLIKVFSDIGWSNKDVSIVSGIGCTGRAAGYINVDSCHTTHGRALPVAEGLKLSRPELNVVVVSGDGDLMGIGGNHLLHTARRNTNIKVICNANSVYGMTGGQLSPQTPKGTKTVTTPEGSPYNPINMQGIISSNNDFFYARSAVFDPAHIQEMIKRSLSWNGFSFLEIISICPTNLGGKIGMTAADMIKRMKEDYHYQEKEGVLKTNELGFIHS